MRLTVAGVCVQIGGRDIIDAIDLVADSGQMVGLVGPNGSGKSTVLRTVYRALRPLAGVVCVDDDEVWKLPTREAARRTAAVTQEAPLEFDLRVRELVSMGRSPHKGPFDRDSAGDDAIVDEALERTGMSNAAARQFRTLSGGEKQRVMIARALAQKTDLLVLDEPTNHLDIRYQLQILELLRGLGLTVLAALHDLNLAAAYCDHVVVLADGRVRAAGPPAEVLDSELIAEVFGVRAACRREPLTGRVQLTFSALPNVATVRS